MLRLHCVSVIIWILIISAGHIHSSGVDPMAFEYMNNREILSNISGFSIDLEHLLLQYSAICPAREECNLVKQESFDFNVPRKENVLPVCVCSCSHECITTHNCCPGNIHGYLDYMCINVVKYVEKSDENYFMISSCPASFTKDAKVVEKCTSNPTAPVTSFVRNITYRNEACAQCNGETILTPWEVNITCKKRPPNLFKDPSHLTSLLKSCGCNVSFWLNLDHDTLYEPIRCSPSNKENATTIYNHCNMTGYWNELDEHVNWACENLDGNFFEFRNVYCYICNPSVANRAQNLLVDRCYMLAKSENVDYVLEGLCQNRPQIARSLPFKNIHCMLCNGRSFLKGRVDTYINVEEKIIGSNSSVVRINIEMPNDHAMELLELFNEIYKHNIATPNQKINETNRIVFDNTSISELITSYVAACGDMSLCRKPHDAANIPPAGIPMCGNCSCAMDCAENITNTFCCPDLIITAQPYNCIAANNFPKIQHTNMTSTGVRRMSYKVIDICVNRTSMYNSLCEVDKLDRFNATLTVPLIAYRSNVMYKNIYCYLCNHWDNVEQHFITINITLTCNTRIEANLYTNISTLLSVSNDYCDTSFIPEDADKCRSTSPANNFTDYYPNITTFARNLTHSLQSNKQTYIRCNQTGKWHNATESIKTVCEGRTESILALPVYKYNFKVYKNFACFICNPARSSYVINAKDTSCTSQKQNSNYGSTDNVAQCAGREANILWAPYTNYFCADCNMSPLSPITVDRTPLIPRPTEKPGQFPGKFGPFWKASTMSHMTPSCEKPHGTDPGSTFRFLFSINQRDWVKVESHIWETTTTCTNGTYDQMLESCRPLYCDEGRVLQNGTCHVVSEVAANVAYILNIKITPDHANISSNDTIDLSEVCDTVLSECTKDINMSTELVIASCNASTEVECITNQTVMISNISCIYVSFTVELISTHHLSIVESDLVKCLSQMYTINSSNDEEILFSSSRAQQTYNATRTTGFENSLDNRTGCRANFRNQSVELRAEPYSVTEMMVCSQIELAPEEFVFDDQSGTVIIGNDSMSKSEGDFKWANSSVRICKPYQSNTSSMIKHVYRPNMRLNRILDFFNRICVGLSLAGLLFTFITYCLFPVLRTLPGKNIMVLTYNLFLAQVFLQFGFLIAQTETLCTMIGICLHYFWLSSFCAMNICSYHMIKIFCVKFFEAQSFITNRVSFVRYLVYIHGAPAVVIVLTIIVHLSLSHGSFTGYGDKKCFLSDIYSLMSTFIVPATVIFLLNIVFFLAVARTIRSTPQMGSSQHNDFLICVKLCAIVGVSWPLQIVDGMFKISPLSFVATGLNGFQGVYIFISYVCNKRVLGHFRALFARCTRRAVKMQHDAARYSITDPLPSPTSTTTFTSRFSSETN